MEFDPKINFIVGNNGVGKTSVLEAMHLLSTGRSFRTAQLVDLIHHDHPSFYLEAHFIKEKSVQMLKIGYDGKKKYITLNSSQLPAFSHLLGVIPSVIYSPKDISLITGAPVERRRFLNLYLGQSDPLYVHHLLRYTKALEHRNTLLKTQKIYPPHEIECFEKELALSAFYLMRARHEALKIFTQKISPLMSKLTHEQETFILCYEPSLAPKDELSVFAIEQLYRNHRSKEALFGTSLIGPHRDDFSVLLDGHPIKAFCSEGQKQSFLSALKLAEWELLKDSHQQNPLMYIDDLGIHLDKTRETLLETQLQHLAQVFITSPKKPSWSRSSDRCKVFEMLYQK